MSIEIMMLCFERVIPDCSKREEEVRSQLEVLEKERRGREESWRRDSPEASSFLSLRSYPLPRLRDVSGT